MNDLVKKAMLVSMGTVYHTKESLESWWNKLSKEDGVNPDEAKKYVSELKQKADEYREQQMKDIKSLVRKALDEAGVATKTDIEDLKKSMRSKP